MSAIQHAALTPRPGVGKNVADPTGITSLLFRTSLHIPPALQTVTLPADVLGCFLTVVARGCDVQYAVVKHGTTKPTLTYDAIAVAGTGSTLGAAAPTAFDKVKERFYLEPDDKEIVFIWATDTTGGFFEGYVSSRRARV